MLTFGVQVSNKNHISEYNIIVHIYETFLFKICSEPQFFQEKNSFRLKKTGSISKPFV